MINFQNIQTAHTTQCQKKKQFNQKVGKRSKDLNRHFSKQDIQIANKYMKRCPKSLIIQFNSIQSCPTLCDPMNRSMPGLPVHHLLPQITQGGRSNFVTWTPQIISPVNTSGSFPIDVLSNTQGPYKSCS